MVCVVSQQDAKRIIEDIQRQKTGHGLKGLTDPDTYKAWQNQNRQLNNALQKLSSDLYKDTAHFVMELIQNAEDNTYNSDTRPYIRFSINPDVLVISNNEVGFDIDDVESICSVGQTTKSKKKEEGYIGEKGIGFKSVFKVSNSPKIISNGFQFEFRHSDGNELGYIVPYWLPIIPEDVDPRITNIILPLREDVRRQLCLFDKISPTLMLFLRKLQCIEITDNISDLSKVITKSESNGLVTLESLDQKQYWRVIRTTFSVPVEISAQEVTRQRTSTTEIILAFPINEAGLPSNIEKEHLDIFAYLPVKKCGFRFIYQADFLLPSDRGDIQQDSRWNEWLRSNTPDVLIKAIEEFKHDEKLRTTFFKFLSLPGEINDEFFSPLVNQTFQALGQVDCILTESGSWRKPCDVYYAEDDLKTLISNGELLSYFGKEYVAGTFHLKKELRDLLGIADFTSKHFVECLKRPERVKMHSNEWLIEVYRYCAQQLDKTKPGNITLDDIFQLPIIKLENGDYCSANNGQVFFSLDSSGEIYGFESDLEDILKVMDSNIWNAVKKDEGKKGLVEFLKKLSIVNPDPVNIIDQYILPLYQNGTWREKSSETLQGHIHFIKDNSEKVQKSEQTLEKIREQIYLRVNGKPGQSDYSHLKQIYMSEDYGSDYHLSSVMADVGENFFLENSLHPCYIRSDLKNVDAKIQQIRSESKPKRGRRVKKRSQIKKQVEELKRHKNEIVSSWKEFVMTLGVREGIIVSLDPETELDMGGKKADNVVTKKKIYPDNLDETPWNSSGWRKTKDWYFLEDDYISTDLDRVFDCFNKATSKQKHQISSMLFRLFANNWEEYLDFLKCRYYFRRHNEQGWSSDSTQTTFLIKLKTFPWVTTIDGSFAPLNGLFLDNSDIRRVLGNSARFVGFSVDPTQHAKFIRDVEIRTEININEVIEVIAGKTSSGSEDVEEFKFLYLLLQGLIPKYVPSRSAIAQYQKPKPNPALHPFREERLIFIPETDQKYFTANDVFWSSKFDDLKEYLPSLRAWYPECPGLFIDNLVVKESPAPEDLVTILEQIATKADRTEVDERKIIAIYKEFNTLLKQNSWNSTFSWWKGFTTKPLLWVNKKQFWRNNSNVFVNDDRALYDLFAEREDVAFLAVDVTDLRDLGSFVKYTNIPKLSESVKCALTDSDHLVLKDAPEWTRHIQNLTPYILRYLYYKHPEDYDRLKSSHKLSNLKDIRCVTLDHIDVEYILRNQTVKTTRDILLDGDTLYIGNIDKFQIPAEFAKFFGPIKGLDIFVCPLFALPDLGSVEKYLDSVKIPQLPDSEVEWFTSLNMIDEGQNIQRLVGVTEKPLESEPDPSSIFVTTLENHLLPKETSSNLDAVETLSVPPGSSIPSISSGDIPCFTIGREHAIPPSSSVPAASLPISDNSDLDRIPTWSQSGQPRTPSHPERSSQHRNVEGRSFELNDEDIDAVIGKNPELVKLVHVTFSPRQRMSNPNDLKTSKLPEKLGSEGETPESEQYGEDKRRKIGRWGEEVVYLDLKREMQNRYPGTSISETEDGFILSHHNDVVTEVIWHNKVRGGNDRGYGHDIKVIENGTEIYVEVKSSIKPREAFMLSKNEWDLAKESGDRYFIYYVYHSPQEGITICEKIQNPVSRWQLGELEARIIQVQL